MSLYLWENKGNIQLAQLTQRPSDLETDVQPLAACLLELLVL